jgi:hypothetical protein
MLSIILCGINMILGVIFSIRNILKDEDYIGWMCDVLGWLTALLYSIQLFYK